MSDDSDVQTYDDTCLFMTFRRFWNMETHISDITNTCLMIRKVMDTQTHTHTHLSDIQTDRPLMFNIQTYDTSGLWNFAFRNMKVVQDHERIYMCCDVSNPWTHIDRMRSAVYAHRIKLKT